MRGPLPRFLSACLLALGLAAAAPAWSQSPAPAPAAEAAPPPPAAPKAEPPAPSAETRAARQRLDALKIQLDQQETAFERPNLSDAELQAMRQQLDPVSTELATILEQTLPRLDSARARLGQLGAKPKNGEPEESPDVRRDRSERENLVAEYDETQRLARALQVQVDQITTAISDRRRASFTRALFERSSSILSPTLWSSVAGALPRDFRVLQSVATDWLELARGNARPLALLALGLAVGIAIALYVGRRNLAPRLVTRDRTVTEPPQVRRALSALAVLVLGAVPAAFGSYIVYTALDGLYFLPPRMAPVVAVLLGGIAFIAFVRALADAALAPGHGAWRIIPMMDASAERLSRFSVALATLLVTGKTIEALNQATAAALMSTIAMKAVVSFLVALTLAELLRRFASTQANEEECLGPYVSNEPAIGGPLRMFGWVLVAAVVGAVLFGYVALAWFLVDQMLWVGIVGALFMLLICVVDELIGGSLKGETRVSTMIQANLGLRRRSLEQVGVLANGIARLALIIVAIALVLAPWGLESGDLLSSVRAAFFGFRVGEVTLSLSTVVGALVLFGICFFATRMVQRWLEHSFLPATELDAGLRNSILTVLGYVGFIAAAAAALSYVGFSLDRIAIVAGALSVGIGFGLQSIVNNFVSGLILLWERPIRVGDLVVVGADGEGHVRRISVRATEIETGDKATIIVPNSNLISGIVRNKVRGNRMGQVKTSIPVGRDADPVKVAKIMKDAALNNRDILSKPGPSVLFKKITESSLEFELVAFVPDLDMTGRVTSELLFEIYAALRAEKIIAPAGATQVVVRGIEGMAPLISSQGEPATTGEMGPVSHRRTSAS